MRSLLIILVIVAANNLNVLSQDIRIALFYDHLLQSFTFHCTSGEYLVHTNGDTIEILKPGEIYYIQNEKGMLSLNNGRREIGSFREIGMKEVIPESTCRIKAVDPSLDAESYSGEFEISIVHGAVQIINEMIFDKYLAGVVEAEAGAGAPEEFFKAQAVICRTYALKNWNNHQSEGFNLCDETHCQVFNGLSDENPKIYHAVLSTHKIVLADRYSRLIVAAFHSNSGGETQRASAVWPVDHDYLQAIIDPFSRDQKNYRWQDSIRTNRWHYYLKEKGFEWEAPENDKTLIVQNHRLKQFIVEEDTLNLSVVREDFGFRSAFFDMIPQGDWIIVKGKGYGHGIGLSQEGAMQMAREGYSYSDILHYYYHQVKIADIDELPDSELPEVFR